MVAMLRGLGITVIAGCYIAGWLAGLFRCWLIVVFGLAVCGC